MSWHVMACRSFDFHCHWFCQVTWRFILILSRRKQIYSGKKMERETGLEPATISLEGWSSTN